MHGSGWWHNPNVLRLYGAGWDAEMKREWAGLWNEDLVTRIKSLKEQPDVLKVLLTGRGVQLADDLQRLVASRGLDFNVIALKPLKCIKAAMSTIEFKFRFIEDVVVQCPLAERVTIYEDRIPHVEQFRKFAVELKAQMAAAAESPRHVEFEVVHVEGITSTMNQDDEVKMVQKLVDYHNAHVGDADGIAGVSEYCDTKLKIVVRTLFWAFEPENLSGALSNMLLQLLPDYARDGTDWVVKDPVVKAESRDWAFFRPKNEGKEATFVVSRVGVYAKRTVALELRALKGIPKVNRMGRFFLVLAMRKGTEARFDDPSQPGTTWASVQDSKAILNTRLVHYKRASIVPCKRE